MNALPEVRLIWCNTFGRRPTCNKNGTPKRDTREETVETDMGSPPAAVMLDTRAAYAAREDEEALRFVTR